VHLEGAGQVHRSFSCSFVFHITAAVWGSRILHSGWDTSPRWDNGTVEAVDLNAWLRVDQLMLAWMARALGRPSAEVVDWQEKADATAKAMMDWLWSEQDGVFWDRLPTSREWVKVVTPATFWSLLAAVATPAQAARQSDAFLNAANLLPKFAMPCVPDAV
jgi:neutral trehalase